MSGTRRNRARLAAVLALVLVGCGSDGGDTAYVEPTGPAGKTLEVEGTNFKFDPDDLKAPAGVTEFVFTSGDNLHDLRIKGIAGFILEANGGEISLQGGAGEGATFTVTFPLVAQPVGAR